MSKRLAVIALIVVTVLAFGTTAAFASADLPPVGVDLQAQQAPGHASAVRLSSMQARSGIVASTTVGGPGATHDPTSYAARAATYEASGRSSTAISGGDGAIYVQG